MAELKNTNAKAIAAQEKVFELLARAKKGIELTVRDDQHLFPALLNAAKTSRSEGNRFRLIDTGKLSLSELEWLGEAGADIYTSDEARPRIEELDFLASARSRGRAVVAYFHVSL